jgi:hypothetical protein
MIKNANAAAAAPRTFHARRQAVEGKGTASSPNDRLQIEIDAGIAQRAVSRQPLSIASPRVETISGNDSPERKENKLARER